MTTHSRNRATSATSGRAGRRPRIGSPEASSAPLLASPAAARDPDVADRRTQVTYRSLQLRGLGPDEAANLTAFLSGIALVDRPWRLVEVNRLLFLRQLNRSGRFDPVS